VWGVFCSSFFFSRSADDCARGVATLLASSSIPLHFPVLYMREVCGVCCWRFCSSVIQ
jgi:hypothetical protein